MDKARNRNFIGIIGVIIFTLALLIAFFNPPSKGHYNPAQYNKIEGECHSSSSFIPPAPSNKHEAQKSNGEPNTKELCAEHSALAAQWKAIDVTNLTFWAGLLGIWLVGWTLIATRQGASDSKEASRRELRAYITIDEIVGMLPKRPAHYTTRISRVCTTVSFINTGQTPARVLSVEHRWIELTTNEAQAKFPNSENIKSRIVGDYEPTEINRTSIASNGKFRGLIIAPNKVGHKIAQNGWVNTYLDIRLRYADIYNNVWEGNYLLESIKLNVPEEVHATEHQIE